MSSMSSIFNKEDTVTNNKFRNIVEGSWKVIYFYDARIFIASCKVQIVGVFVGIIRVGPLRLFHIVDLIQGLVKAVTLFAGRVGVD